MKETGIETTNTYAEPSPELIAEIRKRLADVPPETLERVHHALMHGKIDSGASILYRAGACFSSGELDEYRKTLFPPNSLVDPLTQDAPVLRNRGVRDQASSRPEVTNVDSPSASAIKTLNPQPLITDNQPPITDHRSLPADNGLLSDLRDLLNRYVVLPEMAAETLALWVVHTYAFTLRQVTTYIGVVSPEKRCGKTTLLELLGRLANRSLAAANISPSAMFRVIEDTQPTLLIDEADTFLEGRDELAGILNAGYRKGNSYVVRVADRKSRRNGGTNNGGTSYTSPHPASPHSNPAPEFAEWTNDPPPSAAQTPTAPTQLVRYSCWCPKVMAAIGRLPDTLADRCIVITMQRKMAGEKCERMRHLNAEDLRKRCAEFVRTHSDQIAHAQPEIPSTVNDRAAASGNPCSPLPISPGATGRNSPAPPLKNSARTTTNSPSWATSSKTSATSWSWSMRIAWSAATSSNG